MEKEVIKCHVCEQEFSLKKNLYAHCRTIHNIELLDKRKEPTFQCNQCDVKLSTKFSLRRHVAKLHRKGTEDHDYVTSASRKSRLACPCDTDGCMEEFLKNSELRVHLTEKHGVNIEMEELIFSSVAKFENWKIGMQRETLSSYVADTSVKTLKNGDKRQYFNCHCSFNFRSKSQKIRETRSMNTNKINKVCPSRIEMVSTTNNEVKINFWKTHCGHSIELGRVTLDKQTRAEIAGKLAEGVTFEHILDSIRNSTDETNQRLALIEKKDLHNIVRDFKIEYETKRHHNDAISIQLWVEEMKELGEDCPVLYYKGQNEKDSKLKDEDFALIIMTNFQASQLKKFGLSKICIDGTHGTNAYDIILYTLMVIDEFGAGCPVAYLFSNRSDQHIFEIFFENIQSKVGIITATVFMSDDAPAFYNAWASVMGEVPHKLLCTWHVDRNWRQNLNKIKGGSEKKALVYKTLRVLLQMVNIEQFKTCLQQVLDDLFADSDTESFGYYFKNYYSRRPETWAYCYRIGLGINTNMYLESFHKTLKYIYLEGKKVQRLDKTVNAVIKLTRDAFFNRLIKIAKNKPGDKCHRIHKSHKISETINKQNIQEIKKDLEWIITSSSNPVLKHQVVKVQEKCADTCLKCLYCNICIHTFRCTCTDHLIKFNICKHIHACALASETNSPEKSTTNKNNNETLQELFDMKKDFVKKNDKCNIDVIKRKLEIIVGLSAGVSLNSEEARSVNKKLDDIIQIFNKKTNLEEVEEVNVQKKITKQVRYQTKKHFFSTKKKSVTTKSLNKPSVSEEIDIRKGLQDSNHKTINLHTSFDHTYM